jgi:hypothetical protein
VGEYLGRDNSFLYGDPFTIVTAMLGVIMFSISSYVTLFMQGARGETATYAGLALIPYLFSWSITATLSAKLMPALWFPRPRAARLSAGNDWSGADPQLPGWE